MRVEPPESAALRAAAFLPNRIFWSGHRHECIDLIDRGTARKKAQELCRFPGPDAGAFDDDCCSRILARFDIPSSDRLRRPRACSCRPLFHVGHCQELA
jgi:hypothetical protein